MMKRGLSAGLRAVCMGLMALMVWVGLPSGGAMALSDQQQLVMEVWRIVNRAYLDESFHHQNWWFIRQKALEKPLTNWPDTYSTISTMLTSLDDPYTRFLPPEQYESLQTSTAGELLGVGLQIAKGQEDGILRVISPIEGSPAERAGILPKDEIIQINGVSTASISLDEAAARMRGAAGTQVTLTVRSGSGEAMEVNLVRDRITLNPVVAQLQSTPELNKFGYIRLSQFNGNAIDDVKAALADLEHQGAQAYILDLRNNPGGLLQAGIEIAKLWLDEGTIVYTVNRQGVLESFEANGQAVTQDPLVVLVNAGTASASEILAGALQDNGRAQLVGEKTFGKGLIQSLFDLAHGAGLAVTVAKYETPNHHDINKLGISPDHEVISTPLTRDQLASTDDNQYQKAIDVLAEWVKAKPSSPGG
jgi:carboxyl-terminal processing protease